MKPLLAALTALALLWACHKTFNNPSNLLPPATQEGKNTFGCNINAEPWVAGIDPGMWAPNLEKIEAGYDEPNLEFGDQFLFYMIANMANDTSQEWTKFSFMPLYTAGECQTPGLFATLRAEWRKGIEYDLDTLFPYQFKITKLDTLQNICAGEFYFTAISQAEADTLRITDGRFDVIYKEW
jgi:hypothetical protein